MNKRYLTDTEFNGNNFTETPLEKGEYDNCSFTNCLLPGAELSDVVFSGCEFENCDLSLAKIRNTAFKDVQFRNCKLLGLQFDNCNPFLLSFIFRNCILNFSSFYRLKLKNTLFEDCRLEEVDFSETELSGSKFINCELYKAIFQGTILEKVDLRSSFNFSIDPESNRIKKAKFSTHNVIGLLSKYDILIE